MNAIDIASERELGVWRIKMEEMEGEIRYYANQVSLSTLTIALYEKEILAPTSLGVTDAVTNDALVPVTFGLALLATLAMLRRPGVGYVRGGGCRNDPRCHARPARRLQPVQ